MKKFYLAIVPVIFWMSGKGEVILTGIMDGTLAGGKPKAIEIFIAGTEDLGGYEIWRSQNGDPFGAGLGSIAALSGIYTNTFVYLVKSDHVAEFHSVFGDAGIYGNVIPLAIVSGNGNEGYQIRDTVGDVVVDQVWLEDPTDSYRDSYWYRRHGTGPDGTWLAANWASPGNDALDNLDEEGLRAAVPFGSYALSWKGFTAQWDDAANWPFSQVPEEHCNVIIYDTVAHFPVIANAPASPAECHDLTLADSAMLTVSSGSALTVNGNLYILGTQSPGRFILQSDSSNAASGSLLLLGTTTDSIRAERYIAGDNSWHLVASPVEDQSIQPAFAPDPLDNTFDLYAWREGTPVMNGWMNIRDENGSLNPLFDSHFLPGKGYLAAYSAQYGGNLIKFFDGIPNQQVTEYYLAHEENYWNLLGNPYTCAIDWSSPVLDKSLVAGGAMYIWDQSLNSGAGGYRTHNGTAGVPAGTGPVIPAMNGFFVQSIDSGTFLVDPSEGMTLAHDPQSFYKSHTVMPENRVRLKISHGIFADETLLIFIPEATNGYDPSLDAPKLSNGVACSPDICTIVQEQHKVSINSLYDFPVSIPVSVEYGESDTLELSAFDFEGLEHSAGLFLEDTKLDIFRDLREDPVYSFSHEVPGNSQRFVLHFMDLTTARDRQEMALCRIFACSGRICISCESGQASRYRLFDLSGRIIREGHCHRSFDISHLPHGAYIIMVESGKQSFTQKIIL